MIGTLFGIGVGPGDPELLTMRAVKTFQQVDVVLASTRQGNEESTALNIAKPYLPAHCQIVQLDFPMTRDSTILQKAWDAAVHTTLDIVNQGRNTAFLTLGDPLIYSTFSYLLNGIKAICPTTPITIIPGITSFQAACAKMHLSLCTAEDNVHLISGINSQEVLEQELASADTAVILKVYRNFAAINEALHKTGRTHTSYQVSYVEQPEEVLQSHLSLETKPPYMTLIISKKPSSLTQ